MTAMRLDVDAALRAMPVAQALRKAALREAEELVVVVDRAACSPLAPSVRVVLMLELAYRALLAAFSVMGTTRVPEPAVRAVSPRPYIADRLLCLGVQWRDRCSGCGRPFDPRLPGHCRPGRCAPITGWEPRITPGLDGGGAWHAEA